MVREMAIIILLAQEVRDIAYDRPNIRVHVAYSQPRHEDEIGIHYDSEGRITGGLLGGLVKNMEAHYFLCGPTKFMAQVQADLERSKVPIEQIHFETFGPAG